MLQGLMLLSRIRFMMFAANHDIQRVRPIHIIIIHNGRFCDTQKALASGPPGSNFHFEKRHTCESHGHLREPPFC